MCADALAQEHAESAVAFVAERVGPLRPAEDSTTIEVAE